MKKFIFLVAFLAPTLMFAQKASKQEQKVIKKVAKGLCDCINKDLNKLDKDVLSAFISAIEHKEGMEAYIMSLKPDVQQRLVQQLPRLSNIGDNMTTCMNRTGLEKEVNNLSMDSDAILQRSIEEMKKMKQCNNVYRILKASDK
jgi:uncharacterized protein